MVQVNLREAKTHLSTGKPIARLVPYRTPDSPRVPGLDRGLFVVPADFNSPLPTDIGECFER